jgi:hypothetical protein
MALSFRLATADLFVCVFLANWATKVFARDNTRKIADVYERGKKLDRAAMRTKFTSEP